MCIGEKLLMMKEVEKRNADRLQVYLTARKLG